MEERCNLCGKILDKDEIGINKKLIDENVDVFECLECLAKDIGVSISDLEEKIEDFKREGCKLFQ